MRLFLPLAALPTLLVGLLACGTETGNPELVEFEYNATSSQPARVRLGTSEGGTSVETVWLRLADVEFIDCRDQLRGTLQGIGFADHGGTEAALQSLELPDVPFCGVQTRLFQDPTAQDEPSAIEGASVSVSGNLRDGRSFRITSRDDLDLSLALQATSLPAQGSWLLAFDVARWLDEAALEALEHDPVVVDIDTHPQLLGAFEDAVMHGALLYEDLNGNGQVEDGEPILTR